MPRELDPAIVKGLTDAVGGLESRSCVEVVVEVRARSGSYAHAEGRFAAVLAFGGLLLLLFSPWPFHAVWVAADVALLYLVGLAVARRSDGIRRVVTSERDRVARVRTSARAVFVERGVAHTEKATGLLLYLSLLERQIEVVEDRGVLEAVPAEEWNRLVAAARASRTSDEQSLLDLINVLGPLLSGCLPAGASEKDELPDLPRFVIE